MNSKPENAWQLYISIENHLIAINILNFISHEFYRMGQFYYSFKAFLFLEKFSPSMENTNGKISSAIGKLLNLYLKYIKRCILSIGFWKNIIRKTSRNHWIFI